MGCCEGNNNEEQEVEHKCCGSDHNHDHDHDHDHDEQYMNLVLEDGSELKCAVLDIFDLEDDRSYIALLPVGDDEVLIYKYIENEDGSFELLNIESDEEFDEVEDAFFELFDDEVFEDVEDVEDCENGEVQQ